MNCYMVAIHIKRNEAKTKATMGEKLDEIVSSVRKTSEVDGLF